MADLNFDDERILFTPIILYIDYIHLLQQDYLKKAFNDLTPKDVTYLINILYHTNCSQRDLADLLFVSESNVTQIIKKLEKKGYIVRMLDDKNKSRKIINLTTKGKNTVLKIIKEIYEWEGEFFNNYDVEDVDKFKRMLYDYSQKTIDSI